MESNLTPSDSRAMLSNLIRTLHLFLNTALCQSPTGISKTQKAIDFIKHYFLVGRFQNGMSEHGVHHMTIVLTNNSLGEASQWTVRLNNKLKTDKMKLNTIILSSKKDSDVKNLNEFWGRLVRLEKADDLPDLIVMCTHERRTSDLIDLIKTLKKKHYDLRNLGIHHISLSIMFDEADKNMKLIVECLKDLWPLLSIEQEQKDNVIRDIHFITATPLEDFWKRLKSCGITKLTNINHAIQAMDESSVLHNDYKTLMEQYRWLKDHSPDHSNESMTEDPVEYAQYFLARWPNQSRIVFAPADLDRGSHYRMRDLFLAYGYWVYVDNSDKGKGKGFYTPQGKFQSVEEFRKQYGVTGEPYETFRKWRELNPTASIAITGWLTIIRGITLNTTGFNFTNMILSACHMKNLADLLQVFGRANGDVKFVGKFTIHCPVGLWSTANERIELMADLHNKNPGEFKEKDFRPRTKKDIMELATTIPIVISITSMEWTSIQISGREYDQDKIIALIANYNSELAGQLKAMEKIKITQPKEERSVKRHITDFIQAAASGKKCSVDINTDKVESKKDLYNIFIDRTPEDPKLIVSIFKGSLLKDEEDI